MKCPNCGTMKSGVLNTEKREYSIDRIRKCANCGQPFHASEVLRDNLYLAIDRIFDEGNTVCIQGRDHCIQMKRKGINSARFCDVTKRRLDPMLCRAFHVKRDWKQ